MDKELIKQSEKRLSKQRKKRRWWSGVVVIALFVLVGTVRLLTHSASATNQAGTGITLQEDWIDKVIVSHTSNPGEWANWTEVTKNMEVAGTDHLRFTLSYVVPEKTFEGQKSNTLIYHIPIEGKVEKLEAQTGTIVNPGNGSAIGSYYIASDGELKLIFEKSFLEKNINSAIEGTVDVEFAAGNLKRDSEGKIELPFSDHLDIHFPTIIIKENHNIETRKQGMILDKERGFIRYIITISSQYGTPGDISIVDTMGRIENNGDITDIQPESITDVKITKNDKQILTEKQTKLPETLPQLKSNEFYTITYIAKIPDKLLEQYMKLMIHNRIVASSRDSNGQTYTSEHSCDVVFEKVSFMKWNTYKDGKIQWTIQINTNKSDISGWILEDHMVSEAVGDIRITPAPGSTGSSEIIHFNQGKYVFPSGSKDTYTITYYTKAPSGEHVKVTNLATLTPPGTTATPIETKSECWVDQKTVTKYDTTNGNHEAKDSIHNFYELKEGKISWRIEAPIPENVRESTVTITEHLPSGISMVQLGFQLSGGECQQIFFDKEELQRKDVTKNFTFSNVSYEIKAYETQNNEFKILVPKELIACCVDKSRECQVDVIAQIPDTYSWTQDATNTYFYSGSFDNKVTVTGSDGEKEIIVGEDSQKQTIQKDENERVIKKSMCSEQVGNVYKDNKLSYELVINPEGKDLVRNSSTVQLEDELTYSNQYMEPFSVSLIPGSLKVFHRNEDGSVREQIPQNECPYQYEESETTKSNFLCKIRLTLPDSTPLLVTYDYFVKCSADSVWIWHPINNTAKLYGTDTSYTGETKLEGFQYETSSATAYALGITFAKVDSNNNAEALQDAEFELSQYNPQSTHEDPYEVIQSYVTKEDGVLFICKNKDTNITYNRAYRLIETKAPDGYILDQTPRYFYIESSNTKEFPLCIPDGFAGAKYTNGQQIFIPNEKSTTSIQVKKEWIDSDSHMAETDQEEIQFDLYQMDSTQKPESNQGPAQLRSPNSYDPATKEKLYGTYTIRKKDGWKWSSTTAGVNGGDLNLPSQEVIDGITHYYAYYVKEHDGDTYQVKYSINAAGITFGTITITNTIPTEFVLPDTGSGGIKAYIFSGWMLVISALGAMVYKQKIKDLRKENKK